MKKILSLLAVASCFWIVNNAFARLPQEGEERSLGEVRGLAFGGRLSSAVDIKFGFDTNPRLSPERKADWFQQLLYAANYIKKLSPDTRLHINYALNATNYSEITDVSRILNYINVGLDKKLAFCHVGAGYNAGVVAYPRNDSDFLYHKGFVYLGKKITPNTFHKLQFEYGAKDYFSLNTLADSIGSYQSEERLDRRLNASYSLKLKLNPRLLMGFASQFSYNDSNARYLDFYDYKAYKQSLTVKYRLLDGFTIFSRLSYRRKEYDSRTITNGTKEQRDNLYSGSFGLRKKLNKNAAISLEYAYHENASNDSLHDYSESVVSCGLRYAF